MSAAHPMGHDDWADAWEQFAVAKADAFEGEPEPVVVVKFTTPCCNVLWIVDFRGGQLVCPACGYVSDIPVIHQDFSFTLEGKAASAYKRMHHWNERISQFLCMETPLDRPYLNKIRDRLQGVPPSRVTKRAIRLAIHAVLGSENASRVVEKWISIRCYVLRVAPPNPSTTVIQTLRDVFPYVENAFEYVRPPTRKSMISYNHLFLRQFQEFGLPEYFKYFPQIKQKNRINPVLEIWGKMCPHLGLEVREMPPARYFRFSNHE